MQVKNQSLTFIAEIGLNHNGSIDLAKKHIEVAKESGADIAKFQNYYTETRAYDKQNSIIGDILKKCELNPDQFLELKNFCDELKIEFASTPFCEKSAELLNLLIVSDILGRYRLQRGLQPLRPNHKISHPCHAVFLGL